PPCSIGDVDADGPNQEGLRLLSGIDLNRPGMSQPITVLIWVRPYHRIAGPFVLLQATTGHNLPVRAGASRLIHAVTNLLESFISLATNTGGAIRRSVTGDTILARITLVALRAGITLRAFRPLRSLDTNHFDSAG